MWLGWMFRTFFMEYPMPLGISFLLTINICMLTYSRVMGQLMGTIAFLFDLWKLWYGILLGCLFNFHLMIFMFLLLMKACLYLIYLLRAWLSFLVVVSSLKELLCMVPKVPIANIISSHLMHMLMEMCMHLIYFSHFCLYFATSFLSRMMVHS